MTPRQELSWRFAPFLRLLPPFLLGVVGAWFFPSTAASNFVGFSLVVLLLLGVYLLPKSMSLTLRPWMGLGVLLWFVLLGYWRGQTCQEKDQKHHFSQTLDFSPDSNYYWSAQISDIRPGTERLRLRVELEEQAVNPDSGFAAMGHLLLYLPADSNSQRLLPGQQLSFYGTAAPLQEPKNPDAFDFAAWQAKRNVFHQLRADKEDWLITDATPSILGRARLVRQQLLQVLYSYLPAGSNELAVAAALILGKRDELSTDLRNAYAETGAIHVLAVSGLHVGLVAGGLAWLLSWGFLGRRSWRWLRFLLVLVGIWSFAFITGMSPSVMRAAVMFSFLEFGRTLGERSNTYNILAASALLLLLINPLLLFDIGFQLSYLAVAGILFFQPILYRLWYTPYRLLDGVWQLSTVAIAAQLVTFPVSLYYFHQFPLYFLLSGLVVVVSASFILYLGILLFATQLLLPFLAKIVATVLYALLYVNNAVIYYIQSLPGHLLEGVWISETVLILLYLMLASLVIYLLSKKPVWFISSLAMLCFTLAANVWQQSQLGQQRQLIVYHRYKASLVDMFDGRLKYSVGTLKDDDPSLDWDVKPHRQARGIREDSPTPSESLHWYNKNEVYGFYDKRLIWVNDSLNLKRVPPEPLEADWVVVSNSPYISLAELNKHYQAGIWIFDGSNYPTRVRSWLAEAEDLDIQTHWTAEQGYYEFDF